MDFFMALLKFALIRIHVLAWPVFALGYPLCASIRSIETGSKYHMRKLVIYWTLFSLISLFEIAFMKIIQWIPFWSSLKLIAILWLVMPRFDGAFHVYQSFIHPYFSSVHLQEIIDNLNMPKEEKALQTQSFLDIAEKYIKENGSEALEKLITSKRDCIERLDSQREQEEKSTAATSEMLKEHNEMLAATAKSTSTEVVLAQYAQSRNVVWVEKVTHEAAEVKEMMAPTEAEDRSEEKGPRKKLEQEWTCGLCSVTTTSEVILNAHLQGKKHKSKCEDLKRIKLIAHAAEQDNMTFTTRNSLFSNGKNPLEFGKNPLETRTKSPSTEAIQVEHARSNKVGCLPKETTPTTVKVKAMTTPPKEENRSPQETNSVKKAQQQWKCDICNVTTTSEITLNSHFQGNKHKSKLAALRTSKLHAEGTAAAAGPSGKSNQEASNSKSTEQKLKQDSVAPQIMCGICNVKLLSEIDLKSHLKGKRHSSNLKMVKL